MLTRVEGSLVSVAHNVGSGASLGKRAKRVLMRGVGAGRSAQRGTSGATTGPRGARSAPP